MFNEFVYEPVTVLAPARQRGESLVQAIANVSLDPPEPVVRRRSRSLAVKETSRLQVSLPALDTPLTPSEKHQLSNVTKWLGQSYDPASFEAETIEEPDVLVQCEAAQQSARDLHGRATSLLKTLGATINAFESVRSQAQSLRIQSDVSRVDAAKAATLSRDISRQLAVLDSLNEAQALLSKPAPRVVRDFPEFERLVSRLREGLTWCNDHPDFVDIDLWELRFRQSLERSESVAGAWVAHELHRAATRLQPRLIKTSGSSSGASEASVAATHALLWTKYAADTKKIRPAAILVRLGGGQAWQNLERTYLQTRQTLLALEIQRYTSKIQPLSPQFLDGPFQTVLAQFQELYDREWQLYTEIIGGEEPSTAFFSWLSELSDGLHSVMRQYIVRETDISKLGLLLGALQGATAARPVWANMFAPMAADAQNRLVFRGELEIDSIARYLPRPRDLQPAAGVFPSVDRALKLLASVYHLLPSRVFSELAHRAVNECFTQLHQARRALLADDDVAQEAWLILQLLALQSTLADFDLDTTLVVHDVDFGGIQALITALPKQRSLQAIVDLAVTSVPRVVETLLDTMSEVYAQLRRAADRLVGAVSAIVTAVLDGSRSPDAASKLFCERAATELSKTRKLLLNADPKAIEALLSSVNDNLSQKYNEWYAQLMVNTPVSELSEHIDAVMDPDVLTSWLAEQQAIPE